MDARWANFFAPAEIEWPSVRVVSSLRPHLHVRHRHRCNGHFLALINES